MIDTLTPTLAWSAVSNADYYALAISIYPYGSTNIVYNRQQLTGTSHTVPGGVLEYGKKYRWNIQAHNIAGWSDVSNTLYFQTPSPPQQPPGTAPSHVSPSNGANDISLTPTFQWSAVSGADYYGLYISEPPYGEAHLVYENENVTSTSLTLPSGILSEGVTYRWNMRAGWGPFSSSWLFTTRSAYRLGIGARVRITADLNVRTGPGTGYPEITDPDYPGFAPPGTIGTVLSGPVSADGYIWWEIDYALYRGWSADVGLEKE